MSDRLTEVLSRHPGVPTPVKERYTGPQDLIQMPGCNDVISSEKESIKSHIENCSACTGLGIEIIEPPARPLIHYLDRVDLNRNHHPLCGGTGVTGPHDSCTPTTLGVTCPDCTEILRQNQAARAARVTGLSPRTGFRPPAVIDPVVVQNMEPYRP